MLAANVTINRSWMAKHEAWTKENRVCIYIHKHKSSGKEGVEACHQKTRTTHRLTWLEFISNFLTTLIATSPPCLPVLSLAL